MPFHIIFEPPVGGARSVGRFACMPACRLTCRQASRMAGWTAGRLKRGQACRHSCRYNHFLKSSHPFIPVLLLGSLGIRKRCFESRNNNTYSNPFAGGLLLSRESSKVSFELPEGFSVTAEKWQQQGMFRVTRNLSGYSPKALPLVAPPKSGNLNNG